MKIIDFLEGHMSFDEKVKFEEQLKNDKDLQAEFDQYQQIYNEFEKVKLETASVTLKSNFEHLLENEMQEKKPAKILTLKNIAAVAAILIIGILVGQNWTQRDFIKRMDGQTAHLIDKMKDDMNSNSVTGRIEAIQVSQKINSQETEVVKTLIGSLKNDESPNVRLAAAEALTRYAHNDLVRSAFVKRLSVEKDPFVLIALINTLSEQKERKAIDPLENLTTAKDVAKFIKDEAHLGLIKIEKI